MDNFLDTHAVIWYLNGDDSLSHGARQKIESATSINFVSIVSLWEIASKLSIDKLILNAPFKKFLESISANGFQIIPVSIEDTLMVAKLPFHHRDPFDRLLICQASNNNLLLISRDAQFKTYNVSLHW